MPTVAEQIELKGLTKGRADVLLELLRHMFSIVPEARRKQVMADSPEYLVNWNDTAAASAIVRQGRTRTNGPGAAADFP